MVQMRIQKLIFACVIACLASTLQAAGIIGNTARSQETSGEVARNTPMKSNGAGPVKEIPFDPNNIEKLKKTIDSHNLDNPWRDPAQCAGSGLLVGTSDSIRASAECEMAKEPVKLDASAGNSTSLDSRTLYPAQNPWDPPSSIQATSSMGSDNSDWTQNIPVPSSAHGRAAGLHSLEEELMKRLRELEEKVASTSQAYDLAQQAVQQASREVQWAVNQEYEIAQAEAEESGGGSGLLGNMLMNSMVGAAMGGGSRSVRSRSANIPLPPPNAAVNGKPIYRPAAAPTYPSRSDCPKHWQGCQ